MVPTSMPSVWRRQVRPARCDRGCGGASPGCWGKTREGARTSVDDEDGCWLARPASCCESSVCWQRKWQVLGQEDTDGGPGGKSSGHTGVWPLEAPGSFVGW